jgi:hypothetical protein
MIENIEPLLEIPPFKYTFNEKRKLFIEKTYSYSDIFLNSVNEIPLHEYKFKGNCIVRNVMEDKDKSFKGNRIVRNVMEDKDKSELAEEEEVECESLNAPMCCFLGGKVYEILNKKYSNVDLFSYCDATSDIDVVIYPPKIASFTDKDIYFTTLNNEINSFYKDFTNWIFQCLISNLQKYENSLENMFASLVEFDIDEYKDIPVVHKTENYGYQIIQIGKLYVVAFLNEDVTMFKIQIVCKIMSTNISITDHIVEIIIPLPESDNTFSPVGDSYTLPKTNVIKFTKIDEAMNEYNIQYNIQSYISLISDNIDAYIERKKVYNSSNEKENIHKPINHIARLFYLYELFYQNKTLYKENIQSIDLFYPQYKLKTKKIDKVVYYKIVHGEFNKTEILIKDFLNAYLELIMERSNYQQLKNTNRTFFENDSDKNELERKHDLFVDSLSNNEVTIMTAGRKMNNYRKTKKIVKTKKQKKQKKQKKTYKK